MNAELKRKIECNNIKIRELSYKIYDAIKHGRNFRIICLDIDNTLIDDGKIRNHMLRSILGEEYDVTMQKANELYASGHTDDISISSMLIGNMLDKVFEEGEPRFVGKMDYNRIYRIENFFPGTIEFVSNLLDSRGEDDYVVLVSHHNVDREGHSKIDIMYDVFPGLDGIFLPKYHDEPYGIPNRQSVSKAGFVVKTLISYFKTPIITNLKVYLTGNLFIVDDSSRVLLDSLTCGANIVPFLPSSIPPQIIGRNYYDDFLSRASRYCDLSKVIVEKNNLNNLNKILLK